jgi:hypothetical protein
MTFLADVEADRDVSKMGYLVYPEVNVARETEIISRRHGVYESRTS